MGWLTDFFSKSEKETDFMKTDKKGAHFSLKGNRKWRYEADIADLEKAIMLAKDPELPSRIELYRIYDNIHDLHVKSQMRTAIFSVIREPWGIFDENDKLDEDATEILQKRWFHIFNKRIVETEFYGHSLLYFWINTDSGEIDETRMIPRIHVLPDKRSIIRDLDAPLDLISYDNEIFDKIFIEVGESDNLGILADVARWTILKWYDVKDWARSAERWGDPHIVLKSASTDETENDEKEEFLRNFGHNGYAMVGEDDEFELLERSNAGTSHQIFLDLLKTANEENSKGINGQVATADQKAFVGAAEVQERILDTYTESRLTELIFFHNEVTLPFLINFNGGDSPYKILKGKRWKPLSAVKDKTKPAKKENPDNPDPKDNKDPKDKKDNPEGVKNPFE